MPGDFIPEDFIPEDFSRRRRGPSSAQPGSRLIEAYAAVGSRRARRSAKPRGARASRAVRGGEALRSMSVERLGPPAVAQRPTGVRSRRGSFRVSCLLCAPGGVAHPVRRRRARTTSASTTALSTKPTAVEITRRMANSFQNSGVGDVPTVHPLSSGPLPVQRSVPFPAVRSRSRTLCPCSPIEPPPDRWQRVPKALRWGYRVARLRGRVAHGPGPGRGTTLGAAGQ